jgi:long-chain acyl-CoA synthetase
MGLAVEFSTIAELFDNITAKFSSEPRPALMYKADDVYKGISYSNLKEEVLNLARGLSSIEIQRGDRVAILSENRPEWVFADMALVQIGAVSVPIYPTLTPKQISYILSNAEVKLLIVSNRFQLAKVMKIVSDIVTLERIIIMNEHDTGDSEKVTVLSEIIRKGREERTAFARVDIKPDDLLTIIYTSGTMGNPKGVMLTHKNIVSNIHDSIPSLPILAEDVLLSYLPLSHSFERMAGYYTAFACGATIAYAESVETVRENILEIEPTIIATVPRLFEKMYNRVMKQLESASSIEKTIFSWAVHTGHKHAKMRRQKRMNPFVSLMFGVADALVFKKIKARTGGRLKFFVSGGAALSRELGEFFDAVGITIAQGYGLTEASPVISVNRLEDNKFGSVGKPIKNLEVKIAADGEILVRGANVMKGYWKDPKATAEMIDSQGWLHTGDIGALDEEGYLTITDRKKHIFVNSGGKNIAPQHIEDLLTQSLYIDQAVLIGENRMYCTALIVPDFDLIADHARKHKIPFHSMGELLGHSAIIELINREIDGLQKDLANYEKVRKFSLLHTPLSIEAGEITPTLKVKRKIVEEKFSAIIARMYDGVASRG